MVKDHVCCCNALGRQKLLRIYYDIFYRNEMVKYPLLNGSAAKSVCDPTSLLRHFLWGNTF